MSKEEFKKKMKAPIMGGSFGDSNGIHKGPPEEKLYHPTKKDWIPPQKESSQIKGYYYHRPTQTLYVNFITNDKVYYYKDFNFDHYNTLQIADRTELSFGSWFYKYVRQAYTAVELK